MPGFGSAGNTTDRITWPSASPSPSPTALSGPLPLPDAHPHRPHYLALFLSKGDIAFALDPTTPTAGGVWVRVRQRVGLYTCQLHFRGVPIPTGDVHWRPRPVGDMTRGSTWARRDVTHCPPWSQLRGSAARTRAPLPGDNCVTNGVLRTCFPTSASKLS